MSNASKQHVKGAFGSCKHHPTIPVAYWAKDRLARLKKQAMHPEADQARLDARIAETEAEIRLLTARAEARKQPRHHRKPWMHRLFRGA